jgi:hypothetical protein
MNRYNCVFSFLLLIMISFFSCQKNNYAIYEELVEEGNNIVKSFNKNDIKVFAETSKNNYEIINNIENWDREYLSILNVFTTDKEKIIKIIIETESEDYTCISSFYYDEKGVLKVLIEEASYFNITCTEGLLNKMTSFYYDNKNVVYKKIEYTDEKNQSIEDTLNCVDNYTCSIKKYYDYKDIPISE